MIELLVYLSVGILFAGFLEEKGLWAVFIMFVWPIIFVGGMACIFMSAIYELGEKLSNLLKGE